jgi:hypothetical protein
LWRDVMGGKLRRLHFVSRSWPLGGHSFGIGRHFHCQILAAPLQRFLRSPSNSRGEHSNPRGVISAASGCLHLAVKMATNSEAVSTNRPSSRSKMRPNRIGNRGYGGHWIAVNLMRMGGFPIYWWFQQQADNQPIRPIHLSC